MFRISPTIGIGPHRLLSKDLILGDYKIPAGVRISCENFQYLLFVK